MKKIFTFILLLMIFATCQKKDDLKPVERTEPDVNTSEAMKPAEINAHIKSILEKTGNFNWTNVDDYVLWSASVHGNNMITLGYGDDGFSDHKSTKNTELKNKLIKKIKELEKNIEKSNKKTLIYDDPTLNFIDVYINDLNTVKKIRAEKGIRYIEPAGYEFFSYEKGNKSDAGCSKAASDINSDDYRTISPGCLVSWTYDKHNITQAWNYSTGQGITVGLIDTGVSPYQSLLGSNFTDGSSSNSRYIYKYGTYVDSWKWWATNTDGPNDKCGHGTSMAATISSPRNNNNMPVGVAYNCNLISYRGTKDVLLNKYHEKKGVAKALTNLGNTSSVKIISMSIGHIFTINRIKDAVKYAYNKGKLIIAAGGTSTWFTNWAGVIFPARMNETVAVTGITDGSGYEECEKCHKGNEIDFTVIMEHYYDTDRHSVCLGFYDNQKKYTAGSSVSTSTTAGIAALVWAKHPTWSRTQVLNKLKQSSEFYPNRNSSFGYGCIDALKAVQ